MVKIGFICEGKTEQILFQSDRFKELLASLNIELLPVIDVEGAGNLLPHNVLGYIESLESQEAEIIFLITDLDEDVCITKTKERLKARHQDVLVIAVKKIEAWFLACNSAMQRLLGQADFIFSSPENENQPFETIRKLMLKYQGRGISNTYTGKIKLVRSMIEAGFDLAEAAAHPNCPSARYLLKKLAEIAPQ